MAMAKITNHSQDRKEAMWEEGFKTKIILPHFATGLNNTQCAADFSLLNLPKGKSLGRSKPATNS